MTAAAALHNQYTLAGLREIVEDLARFIVVDHRTYRHRNEEIFATASVPVASFAMPAAFGTEGMIEAEFQKGVFVGIADEINAAAGAAVTSARPPSRNKLLPPEGNATVTAVAGFNCDFGFVDERGLFDRLNRNESSAVALVFEVHDAGDLREKRVVLSDADVVARFELRAALPDQNRSSRHKLARKTLHAQPL